MQWTFKYWSII